MLSTQPVVSGTTKPGQAFKHQTGDLVVNRTGYPVLQEVINVREDGLLRVPGLEWPPGYSALVNANEVQPMSGPIRDWLST